MKIVLNTVLDNSAKELPAMLKSVVGLVDGIVAVDCVSNDNSLDIMHEWADNNPSTHVACLIEPFRDDLSHFRNKAIEVSEKVFGWWKPSPGGLWGLSVDPHESLMAFRRQHIESALKTTPGVGGFIAHIAHPNCTGSQVRLFRITDHVRWEAPVHEYLAIDGNIVAKVAGGVFSIRSGTPSWYTHDPFRHIRIGRKYVEQFPEDRRSRFFLAHDLMVCEKAPHAQRMAEAEGHLRKYMALTKELGTVDPIAEHLMKQILAETGA